MSFQIDTLTIPLIISAFAFILSLWKQLVWFSYKIKKLEYEMRSIMEDLSKREKSKIIRETIKEIPQPTKTIVVKESKYAKITAYGTLISGIATLLLLILKFIL